jgi:HD-GYP domain-containing protein (c-di-GMP phosphodiesterase class II)
MFAPQPLLNFSEAERPLGERLLKLAAETDRIEGYHTAHAVEIARLAEKLGQRLGLRGVDLSALKFAALAHDLGERALKRDYLLRPGSLTWEEQLDLWRHPIIGEQAAADAKLPRQAQLLIRWHHEWWNGHGYPDGLAGADIPLGARILRVVDTYCALLSIAHTARGRKQQVSNSSSPTRRALKPTRASYRSSWRC